MLLLIRRKKSSFERGNVGSPGLRSEKKKIIKYKIQSPPIPVLKHARM